MARQSRAPILLLTRPLAQGLRFAAQAEAVIGQMQVVQSPLLRPDFAEVALPEVPFSALILTSEAGVEAARRISASGRSLPRRAFCVGDQTAKAAGEAGFAPLSAGGDAAALVAMIAARGERGPFLHLRGRESRGAVAERLNSAGIETIEVISYRQIAQGLSQEAVGIFQNPAPVIVPLFSPRSAGIFAAALTAPRVAPLWIAALSGAVAEELGGLRPDRLAIADHPDAPAMLRAIKGLLAAGPVS